MADSVSCFPVTLFNTFCKINASFAQGLFQFARVEAIELLLANEYQGNAPTTATLKFNECPAIAFNILLAERYSMLS